MDLHLQPDWLRTLGQYVEIRWHGKTVAQGTVDAVMPDSSILWLAASGVHSRQMVQRADGSQVYARYPWNSLPTPKQIRSGSTKVGEDQ